MINILKVINYNIGTKQPTLVYLNIIGKNKQNQNFSKMKVELLNNVHFVI